jgi:hypothetical protein
MHPTGGKIDVIPTKAGKLLRAQPMGVCDEDSRRVPVAVAVLLGRLVMPRPTPAALAA